MSESQPFLKTLSSPLVIKKRAILRDARRKTVLLINTLAHADMKEESSCDEGTQITPDVAVWEGASQIQTTPRPDLGRFPK
jgi:hypothetical protein